MNMIILISVAILTIALSSCTGLQTSFTAGFTSQNTGITYGAKYVPRDRKDANSKSFLDITAQK